MQWRYSTSAGRYGRYSSGRYGSKVKRIMPLKASRCLNQLLLNYSEVFAADSDRLILQSGR